MSKLDLPFQNGRSEAILQAIPSGLRTLSRRIDLKAGETLFRAGARVQSIYLMLEGEVRLVRIGRSGVDVTLQRARDGFVAEASLDSSSYHCDAVSTIPSVLLAFPVGAFRSALVQDSGFGRLWQSLLARQVRQLRAQCERLVLKSAEERIVHYLESEGVDGVVVLPMTKMAWASDLGLTHEALYRALKRMRDGGFLAVDGQRLELVPRGQSGA